jgi:hypothetical protein
VGGGWNAEARFETQGGTLVITDLRIVPAGDSIPAGGVTASTLRRLQIGELRKALEAQARHLSGQLGEQSSELLGQHGLAELAHEASAPAARDDRYFARIAARYAELVAEGNKRPTPVLAGELGRPESYVTFAVRDARKRGLLTPTTKGRAGGRLTPKARRLLAQHSRTQKEEQ